ncbi:hypothetical protein NKH23_13640 [Mesorhizobium sp. M1328]|uniref:hypothetical protein n=1 Tax=Mesorhizobium sp. M1328 TaxID=2957082 RepID=UPI003338F60C
MDSRQHARQVERALRATETPIVDDLPDCPGILATMMISPDLATPLRLLADTLLVKEFPGAKLIASAFCMYNRMLDGFRARTPLDPTAFEDRAQQIASYGYSDLRVTAVPTAA